MPGIVPGIAELITPSVLSVLFAGVLGILWEWPEAAGQLRASRSRVFGTARRRMRRRAACRRLPAIRKRQSGTRRIHTA